MRKSHPQYLRPTVAQVICQIRFTASEKWQANRPQELLSRLAGDYPIVEPVAPVFAIQIGPTAAPSMRSVSGVTTSVIKVSSPDQAVSITLGQEEIVFTRAANYQGWPHYKSELSKCWEEIITVAAPTSVRRLSLRYLNLIPRDGDEPPGEWVRPTNSIPNLVLRSMKAPFFSRSESWYTPTSLMMVTLGLGKTGTAEQRNIVLDIERIEEKSFEPDPSTLQSSLDDMHEEIWVEFEDAQTPRLKSFLNGNDKS